MRSWLILAVLLLTACDRANVPGEIASSEPEVVTVYTVNYPLAWAAERLGAESVQVHFPAPADIDPAFWEPDLETLAGFQQADLILLNGAGYAQWLSQVSLPLNRVLDTSRDFADRLIPVDSGPVHSHGPTGEHSHGELAFTLWLDLELLSRQSSAIEAALVRLFPEQTAEIGERAEDLRRELSVMDAELLALGEQLAGAPLLYSHPVYQYLQRRYGLNGEALHWEPGELPDEQAWSELDALLARHPARLMLWEDEPLPATREKLAERGIDVIVFLPLGNRPESGDFAGGMAANIERLRTAIPPG